MWDAFALGGGFARWRRRGSTWARSGSAMACGSLVVEAMTFWDGASARAFSFHGISKTTFDYIFSGFSLTLLSSIYPCYLIAFENTIHDLSMATEEGWHTVEDGTKLYTKTWKVARIRATGDLMLINGIDGRAGKGSPCIRSRVQRSLSASASRVIDTRASNTCQATRTILSFRRLLPKVSKFTPSIKGD